VLVITFGCIAGWRGAGQTARQAQPEAAYFVAAHVADMLEQQFIEGVDVIILRRRHLFQHIRMAADRALTKDHHITCQNVCPFNRDTNRRLHIGAG
jgi:hypothetical protein